MKFSAISAILLGAVTTVFADLNYFDAPRKHSIFGTDDSITFVVDEVTNDYDDTLRAELYSAEDGSWIETLGEWTGKEISGDDNFVFTWDVDVEEGLYYVRVFEVDGAGDDEDEQDDITRSHTFKISDEEVYEDSENKKAYSAYSTNNKVAKEASKDTDVATEASTDETAVAEEADATQEAGVAEEADAVEEAGTVEEADIAEEADADKELAKEASNDNKKIAEEASVDKDSKKIASASRRRRSIYSA